MTMTYPALARAAQVLWLVTGATRQTRSHACVPETARYLPVPVWFDVDGDDIVFISARDTAKVRYIQANPKGAVTIGGDGSDGEGYLLKGQASVEEDPGLRWMKQLTYRYEPKEKAEKDIADWSSLDMIIIRLKPQRVLKV